jgi:hypothetical protein
MLIRLLRCLSCLSRYISLAIFTFARPELAKRFLESFASTQKLHFIEMIVRVVVGSTLIYYAPQMRFSRIFTVIGWIIIGTTVVLLFVPWKLHRRFAEWSVRLATERIMLLGFGSFVIGVFTFFAFFLGSDTR